MTSPDRPPLPSLPEEDPTIQRWGDGYLVEWPAPGVRIEFHRLRDEHGNLHAEMQWWERDAEGWGRASSISRVNLLAGTTLRSEGWALVGQLGPEFNWPKALAQAADMVILAHRAGAPVLRLADIDAEEEEQTFLLAPWLPDNTLVGAHAPQESGKSSWAQGLACAVASGKPFAGREPRTSGPVLYLDWETNEKDWGRSMRGICRGMGVDCELLPVHYRKMRGAFVDQLGEIRTEVDRLRAVLVIIDSVAWAVGGGATAKDDSTAILMTDGMKSFGCTVLALGHQAKNQSPQMRGAPPSWFGSVFFTAGARYVWRMKARRKEHGILMHFVHEKNNAGDRHDEIGVEMTFGEEGTVFRETVITSERSQLRASIVREITERPWQKVSQLAEVLGGETAQVAGIMRELYRAGEVVQIQRFKVAYFALPGTIEPCFLCLRPGVSFMPDGRRMVCAIDQKAASRIAEAEGHQPLPAQYDVSVEAEASG